MFDRIKGGHWLAIFVVLAVICVGLALGVQEAPAGSSRAYGLGAAIDDDDGDAPAYMRLKADVASGESTDAAWDIRIDATRPGGPTERGAALASGAWDRPGWTGLKLAGTGIDITDDPSATVYMATITVTDEGGDLIERSVLTYVKP